MIKRILFSITALILIFCGKSQAQEVKSIKNAIDTSTVMSQDAKTIFKLIGFNEKDYGNYALNDEESINIRKNGFNAILEAQNSISMGIFYQLYKTNSGKYLAGFCIGDINQEDFWYYENGKLIKAKDILPKPTYNKKTSTCSYIMFQNGIECNIYNRNTQQTTKEMYSWDGEKFVKQE